MSLDELKENIVLKFDEAGLLDFLDVDMWELVELLEDKIKEKRVELEEAVE